jgi:NAD(P)-dependent dehydrogenase (short-subunit alcohol dehydrogenase family)
LANGHQGKCAVVTGGSSGIGAVICERLAREGLRIAILDRLDGAKTLAQVRAAGSDGAWFACDITDPAQVQRAVKEAGEQFGNLPVLVHCAGIYLPQIERVWLTNTQVCGADKV